MTDQDAFEYVAGYEGGLRVAQDIAPGQKFEGAFGYADRRHGRGNRRTPAWKGAVQGYLDGLPPNSGIHCGKDGIIISY